MNLSGRKWEIRRQIGFHLVHVTTQEGVEGAKRVDGVVAAIDLVHNQPHRVVLRSDLVTVVATVEREAFPERVQVLEKQRAIPRKSHTRNAISIAELPHALAIGYESQIHAVKALPIRLIVRERLRGFTPIESKRKLVQRCRTPDAGVPH